MHPPGAITFEFLLSVSSSPFYFTLLYIFFFFCLLSSARMNHLFNTEKNEEEAEKSAHYGSMRERRGAGRGREGGTEGRWAGVGGKAEQIDKINDGLRKNHSCTRISIPSSSIFFAAGGGGDDRGHVSYQRCMNRVERIS